MLRVPLRLVDWVGSVFREQGTDAPLETIARQAGVAIGTLGDRMLAEPAALRALTDWMHAATRHAAAYRGLAAMLADGATDEQSELHPVLPAHGRLHGEADGTSPGRRRYPPRRDRGRCIRAHQRRRLDRRTGIRRRRRTPD
jgi:hypothetical protein